MTLATAVWLARAAHLAGVLSFAGTLTLRAAIVRPVLRGADATIAASAARMQCRVISASLAVTLAAELVWLPLQTAAIADTEGVRDTLAMTGVVLGQTLFGHALLLRFGLLIAAACAWPRPALAAVLGLAAAAAEAGMGHAIASDTWSLPVANGLHVAAAAAWLGGLVPLVFLIRRLPGTLARQAATRFAPLGIGCVAVLAGTALVQARALVGGLAGLAGTAYGHIAALKLGMFAALVTLAALNRRFFAPDAERRPGRLVRSIAVEAGGGLLIVVAAARLSQTDPGAHTQPVWPFAWQPNFSVLADPDLWREAWLGAAIFAAAIVALAVGAVWRRRRIAALALGLAGLVAAWPHLDLFAAPAVPTSFYVSTSGFTAQSIADGQALFAAHCAACHGATGHGDGPVTPPGGVAAADLTADHIWDHSDGELFWWLGHGIAAPDGSLAMPGFPALSDDERWALIDFVHANAAGAAMAARGARRVLVQAPGLSASCPDGRTLTNEDFRGAAWQVTVGGDSGAEGLRTVRLGGPGPGCADPAGAARHAYALVAGVPDATLDGTRFLIDAEGWLRDRALPGGALHAGRAAQPLPQAAPGHHH